jgi:hypothetical protein
MLMIPKASKPENAPEIDAAEKKMEILKLALRSGTKNRDSKYVPPLETLARVKEGKIQHQSGEDPT